MKLKSRCGITQVQQHTSSRETSLKDMSPLHGSKSHKKCSGPEGTKNHHKKWAQLLTFCQDQSHLSLAEVPHDLCGRTSCQTPPESVYPFNSDLEILEISPHHHSILWSQSLAGSGRTWLRGTAKPESKMIRNPFIP